MPPSTNKTIIRNDLNKLLDQNILIKLQGGRQITGKLKGFDDILNLVLDDTFEALRDTQGEQTSKTRSLGLVIVRGTQIAMLCTGLEEIQNPFVFVNEKNSEEAVI